MLYWYVSNLWMVRCLFTPWLLRVYPSPHLGRLRTSITLALNGHLQRYLTFPQFWRETIVFELAKTKN